MNAAARSVDRKRSRRTESTAKGKISPLRHAWENLNIQQFGNEAVGSDLSPLSAWRNLAEVGDNTVSTPVLRSSLHKHLSETLDVRLPTPTRAERAPEADAEVRLETGPNQTPGPVHRPEPADQASSCPTSTASRHISASTVGTHLENDGYAEIQEALAVRVRLQRCLVSWLRRTHEKKEKTLRQRLELEKLKNSELSESVASLTTELSSLRATVKQQKLEQDRWQAWRESQEKHLEEQMRAIEIKRARLAVSDQSPADKHISPNPGVEVDHDSIGAPYGRKEVREEMLQQLREEMKMDLVAQFKTKVLEREAMWKERLQEEEEAKVELGANIDRMSSEHELALGLLRKQLLEQRAEMENLRREKEVLSLEVANRKKWTSNAEEKGLRRLSYHASQMPDNSENESLGNVTRTPSPMLSVESRRMNLLNSVASSISAQSVPDSDTSREWAEMWNRISGVEKSHQSPSPLSVWSEGVDKEKFQPTAAVETMRTPEISEISSVTPSDGQAGGGASEERGEVQTPSGFRAPHLPTSGKDHAHHRRTEADHSISIIGLQKLFAAYGICAVKCGDKRGKLVRGGILCECAACKRRGASARIFSSSDLFYRHAVPKMEDGENLEINRLLQDHLKQIFITASAVGASVPLSSLIPQ